MSYGNHIFHLAIPCRDVAEAEHFYGEQLGCEIGRRYAAYVTLSFFGHQVVCHLDREAVVEKPQMYPRHFGTIFEKREDFEKFLAYARAKELPFFQEPMKRHVGKPEEHTTFFLQDPSNNLLEFKCYADPAYMR